MKTKPLAMVTIVMLVLSAFAIFPNVYAVSPSISLSPSNNIYDTDTAYVGYKFNVTVSCSDVPDLGGANIRLEFNDSIINVTRWWAPSWDPSFFMPLPYKALPTPPYSVGYIHVGPGNGYVKVAVSKAGEPPSAPWGHAGKICMFEFNVTAIPPKQGKLNCTLKIDSSATYLLDPTAAEVPDVVKNDGSYELTWAEPDPARMGVQPKLTEYGPYPPSAIGEDFDIGVYIEDLDEAWYLTSASFDLYYNATVIDVLDDEANVTWATIWGTHSIGFTRDPDPAVLDYMSISVSDPSETPGGSPPADELVATLKFTVLMQHETPPCPVGYFDGSPLDFDTVVMEDHIGPVTTTDPNNGEVKIYALMTIPMALLKVQPPSVVLGPDPSIGDEFDIDVIVDGPTAEGLHWAWYLIGFQFRLYFDNELLEVVSITEGPFLKDGPWNLYGTFFVGVYNPDTWFDPHVMVGQMLYPNATGHWDMTSWPNGTGTIVTIRFKAIKQECPLNFTCELGLGPLFPDEWAVDRNGEYVPIDEASIVNGTYTMLSFDMPGRWLDVWGGAKNDGYWTGYPAPFPAPWGGQGNNQWMDLVFPQSEVTLYAYVAYNYWPVQRKDVGFEIEGPYEKLENGSLVKMQRWQVWAKFTATTDEYGQATLVFRMPWPCDDPDGITGIWKITATTTLADEIVTDTMIFYYERVVYTTKVTTDKFYYTHCEDVVITVEYKTHSVQTYPILFAVTLTDDLGVPFGMAIQEGTIGGATWCTWKTGEFSVKIHVVKWAYAGYGLVHVSAYDKDPTEGGEPYCPEYPPVEFQIGPY